MSLAANFGENLRRECEKQGISQQRLADLTGIHRVTINRIFQGKVNVTISVCERLAAAVQERPESLFLEPVAEMPQKVVT